jgi:pyruvate dehydrogenase E1 component alpha subunit
MTFCLVDVSCGVFKHAGPSRASRASPGELMSDPGDNLRRLTGLYSTMARIRAFEETALEAHKAGEIPVRCTSRSGRKRSPPASASICASTTASRRTIAGHGHAIAKGADRSA